MIYETLLAVGGLGLLAQTVLGFAHGHGDHHGGHHGEHSGNGHQAHGHGHAHSEHGEHHGEQKQAGPSPLWAIFSPLTIFSISLGAGATGLLAGPHLSAPLTGLAAAGGGIAFYGLFVRPLWTLLFRFTSEPARALDGSVAASAEAVTRFDEKGQGIVRLTVDGQIVRVLAHLESDDRAKGVDVRPGDRLVVTSVDGQKNTCRVSRF